MATQAALRDAEWDVVDLLWEHGPSPIQCVFRRIRGGWEPWVIVARSAIMARVGREGLGLYAARSFKQGQFLGRYSGEVVGRFRNREEALASAGARRLLAHGNDKLLTVVPARGGVELIDGESAGPPFFQRMNDPIGTRLSANVRVTSGGWVEVKQKRIPAFRMSKSVEQNIASELRFEYGSEYWDLMSRLGSKDAPIDLDF